MGRKDDGYLKYFETFSRAIFIICLPLLFLSASLAWGFNSYWLYTYGFEKYDVSQRTGLTGRDLEQTARGLIDYFGIMPQDEYIQVVVTGDNQPRDLFTLEEQIHFKDVRRLVMLDYTVLIVTAVIVLGYAGFQVFRQKGGLRRRLARSVIWGSGLSILIIIMLGAASFLDFDRLFLQFHYLAFTNEFWSAEGYMLQLFPGGFWFDAALICTGFMAGLAVISGLAAYLFLRLDARRRG